MSIGGMVPQETVDKAVQRAICTEQASVDTEHEDVFLTNVKREEDGCFHVATSSGFSIYIQNELEEPHVPCVYETMRLFGRGMGYPVRGIAILEAGNITAIYRYQTVEEAEAEHVRNQRQHLEKARAKWDAERSSTADRIAKLPKTLRTRMEFFLRDIDTDWGPEFGFYELFCCEEAAKMIEAVSTVDQLDAFLGLSMDEQKQRMPMLDYDNHTGNSFGISMVLTRIHLEHPELVWKYHGAICRLVGCHSYGCYASTLPENAPKPMG